VRGTHSYQESWVDFLTYRIARVNNHPCLKVPGWLLQFTLFEIFLGELVLNLANVR
jgi:hypothetical protein